MVGIFATNVKMAVLRIVSTVRTGDKSRTDVDGGHFFQQAEMQLGMSSGRGRMAVSRQRRDDLHHFDFK